MFENPAVSVNALCNWCARIAWFWGWMNSGVYKIKVYTPD